MRQPNQQSLIDRRGFLQAGAWAVLLSYFPARAIAKPADMVAAQKSLFGDRPVQHGKVHLSLPPLAENGYSVPFDVTVDSPMTAHDYVRQIAIFSEENPLPDIARFQLGADAGRAHIATRIRLSGTQTVHVITEMNDGSLWTGSAHVIVTLAACVVL